MSAQYRTEWSKMVDKYCRAFGVDVSLVARRNLRGEDEIHCPSQPELPAWGMGNNSEDWQDGPTQDKPQWATRPPKTVIVSRMKR